MCCKADARGSTTSTRLRSMSRLVAVSPAGVCGAPSVKNRLATAAKKTCVTSPRSPSPVSQDARSVRSTGTNVARVSKSGVRRDSATISQSSSVSKCWTKARPTIPRPPATNALRFANERSYRVVGKSCRSGGPARCFRPSPASSILRLNSRSASSTRGLRAWTSKDREPVQTLDPLDRCSRVRRR